MDVRTAAPADWSTSLPPRAATKLNKSREDLFDTPWLVLLLAAVVTLGGRRLAAQAPPSSDVAPAVTRLAWEDTGYAS